MARHHWLIFILGFGFLLLAGPIYAGPNYPQLIDGAIFQIYEGGGFYFGAQCSVCHGSRPETAANAQTDFGTDFKSTARLVLPGRANLSGLTQAEMMIIVAALSTHDPDHDGYTNEQEFGWDEQQNRYVDSSNPNDYFSTPMSPTSSQIKKQGLPGNPEDGLPRMGGCMMSAQGTTPASFPWSSLVILMPILLTFWRRLR